MTIAITGHRPNKLGGDYDFKSPLMLEIKSILQKIIDERRPNKIISGMALGIDTLWAILALENNIPLVAAIPCLGQENMWVNKSKDLYNEILEHELTEVVYVTKEPYNIESMQLRNVWMVDNSELLIAVWDGTNGGTGNCVKYAISQNKEIIFVNPNDIRALLNIDNNKIINFFKKHNGFNNNN